mmetsp:Transcript_4557/g.13470  ORF Transcript_4557/g.13470 Transcript_4557/m.13470 type:complete len:501 (-) Transcript_4557:25-1527(-)
MNRAWCGLLAALAAGADDWHRRGDPSKTCAWVAQYVEGRCGHKRGDRGAKGEDGRFASDACAVCSVPPVKTFFVDAVGRSAVYEFTGKFAVRVAVVDNPQMRTLQKLAPAFTAESGIDVEFSLYNEDVLRAMPLEGSEFDVVMVGMFDAPISGARGELLDLTAYAEGDEAYDLDDVFPAVRAGLSADAAGGRALYASPFYGESSFVMYRADLLEAEGLAMPDEPTWEEVKEIALAVAGDGIDGICLRGKPGWGALGAVFTTVLNTFGGTWWNANADGSIGTSGVADPEYERALRFYADLSGRREGAESSSYLECLTAYLAGEVAMWYDATAAAGILEENGSPVQGKNGYAQAPVERTESAGWLWAWALAVPSSRPEGVRDDAWAFIAWATGKAYIQLAGAENGWASVPAGTRASTFDDPSYAAATEAFSDAMREALATANPDDPGLQPRPGNPGVQYVGVPAFREVGDACTTSFSEVIAGTEAVMTALSDCDEVAAAHST